MFGFGGGSSGGRGEASRPESGRMWGLCAALSLRGRSDDASFGGGAAGNLKFWEKDPEGLRDVKGNAGVFGAVETPGVLRPGRAGRANSWEGSCIVGGEAAPPESGDCKVAERMPGEPAASHQRRLQAVGSAVPESGLGRPGMTWRLADLPCPRAGRREGARSWLTSVAASVPRDMMDSDLPCVGLEAPLLRGPLGSTGERRSPADEGVCSERVGRWPRRCCGGPCDAKDEFRETEGRVDECTGGSLRWRSPPGAKPFALRIGERSRPPGGATFLNVMVHSMSSPANTVEFFHCTKTRMFEAMVAGAVEDAGCGIAGSSSAMAGRRHVGCQASTSRGPQQYRSKPAGQGAAATP